MKVILLTIVIFLILSLAVSIAQEEEIDTGETEEEIPICGDGKCTSFEDEKVCPKDCKTEDEIIGGEELAEEPTTVEEPSETPETQIIPKETEQEETTVEKVSTEEEIKEKRSFLSSWTFKIILIATSFLIAGLVIFFIYQKKTATKLQGGIIEEQKSEETKTATEETVINPQLIEYIKTNLKKGFTKEQIRIELVKVGWDIREVDKALTQF